MSVLDWADLTADQRRLLTRGQALQFDVGAEVLNADLSLVDDISEAIDNTAGDVSWNGSARIHRDVSINLALSTELAWGSVLLRVYRIVTDQVSGLAARKNRGVFCLTAPGRPLGVKVLNPASRLFDQYAYTVTGQDRLYRLDREVGYSYVQPMLDSSSNPVTVLQAIRNVYAACGITGYLIDGSRAAAVLPQDMTWPLIPSSTSSSTPLGALTDPQLTAPAGSGGASTWLDVLNDLNALITYQATYCDDDGYLRHTPYVDPATAVPVDMLDADATGNIVDPQRKVTRDLWGAPNKWIGIWQNMPDSGGSPVAPTVGNGGIYSLQNDDEGPASITALGGEPAGLRPKSYSVTAASATDLQSQVAAQKAADMRVVTQITLATSPYVAASHFDVLTYRDTGLPDDLGGQVTVRVADWTENFDASNTTWTVESI